MTTAQQIKDIQLIANLADQRAADHISSQLIEAIYIGGHFLRIHLVRSQRDEHKEAMKRIVVDMMDYEAIIDPFSLEEILLPHQFARLVEKYGTLDADEADVGGLKL